MHLKQKKSKKTLFVLSASVIIITAALLYIFAFNGAIFGWQFRSDTPSNVNLAPPTDEERDAGQQIKEDAVNQNPQGKPTTEENSAPNATGTLQVGFSAVNQNEGKLQIRIMIQEVLPSGSCTATFSQDSKIVTKTAAVYPTASISTCQGFDIATSELGTGTWKVTVEVTSGSRKGQVTTDRQIN